MTSTLAHKLTPAGQMLDANHTSGFMRLDSLEVAMGGHVHSPLWQAALLNEMPTRHG